MDASSAVSSVAAPMGIPARSRNDTSKPTLWPTKHGAPSRKAKATKRAAASCDEGACWSSSSRIPVSLRIGGVSGRPGFAKVRNRSPSVRAPSDETDRRIAPISMISSVSASYPVVSRSTAIRTRSTARRSSRPLGRCLVAPIGRARATLAAGTDRAGKRRSVRGKDARPFGLWIGILLLIVLLAVLAGGSLALRGESAPTPTPSALASAVAPTPPGPLLSDSRGFIALPGSAAPAELRRETDSAPISTLRGQGFMGAVSGTGRRVAYWVTTDGATRELRVLDVTAPDQDTSLATVLE